MTSAAPWPAWTAIAVGVGAVASGFAVGSTPIGQAFAVGFGAFIAFFGILAVLATDRTPDYWGLVVIGLSMSVVPFLGSAYSADLGAALTCWLAGAAAMVVGGIGWLRMKMTDDVAATGNVGDAERSAGSYWIGWAALIAGVAAALLGVAVADSAAATGSAVGLGGFVAVLAVWSLLAVEPTIDFLMLGVVGLGLLMSPWLGGFVADSAAAVAWVAGASATALGVIGYLRGERLGFAARVRVNAAERYRMQFR